MLSRLFLNKEGYEVVQFFLLDGERDKNPQPYRGDDEGVFAGDVEEDIIMWCVDVVKCFDKIFLLGIDVKEEMMI